MHSRNSSASSSMRRHNTRDNYFRAAGSLPDVIAQGDLGCTRAVRSATTCSGLQCNPIISGTTVQFLTQSHLNSANMPRGPDTWPVSGGARFSRYGSTSLYYSFCDAPVCGAVLLSYPLSIFRADSGNSFTSSSSKQQQQPQQQQQQQLPEGSRGAGAS